MCESQLIVVCPIKVGKVFATIGFHTLVCKTPCIGIATYGETHHSEVFSNDSDTLQKQIGCFNH